MQTHASNSQLLIIDSLSTTLTSPDSQKAWHILSLLLSLGHPTPLPELASRCSLFPATPDLIQSLASVPNSPITYCGNNSYVTISAFGLFALKRFSFNSNSFDKFTPQVRRPSRLPVLSLDDTVKTYFRKRKRIAYDPGDAIVVYEKDSDISSLSKRIRRACAKEQLHISKDLRRSTSVQLNSTVFTADLFFKILAGKLSCELEHVRSTGDRIDTNWTIGRKICKEIMACPFEKGSNLPNRILDVQAGCQEDKAHEIDLQCSTDFDAALYLENVNLKNRVPVESASVNEACDDMNGHYVQAVETEYKEGDLLVGSGEIRTSNVYRLDILPENNCERMNKKRVLDKEQLSNDVKNEPIILPTSLLVGQTWRQSSKSSAGKKIVLRDAMPPRQQAPCQLSEQRKVVNSFKEKEQLKRDHVQLSIAQKLRQKNGDIRTKEGRKDAASIFPKDQVKAKGLPCFDSYLVDEEEGSGGYGIVYRARRKHDGTTVAIKCPHENAHRHHVTNELRMLERFGGKNFVIRYEGHFKHGNSECFVLEHVEHDRPEVLKKEIDVFQLRWYGYCMFRALASLHKQGVVHRDVKPGNFLFSRKANKGYLIDFNLALDLHQKHGATNKLKAGDDVSYNNTSSSNVKYVPPTKSRRFPIAKTLHTVNQEETKVWKSTLEPKSIKRKAIDSIKVQNDMGGSNIMKSQGADGSGVTSVKDVTSTRTPSAERLREPLPCQGRKELINLLQEAMQSPNHQALSVPASMRKRIAAPHGKVDGRHIYLTPMPVHSTGISVATSGLFKNKGDVKHKKEGPCVGTKGFRAPEVLFRSLHQGPKVDIWSAGVTLLYLIVGRTPFYGDPEQNVKDIAKLRGSEDLWEVSKLHDRESSFPVELYNAQSLPSMTLLEWCQVNTKRRDFLNAIPSSLIDLVDKCLTVNPRSRISAEDALKHEFFAPCNEGLRKQRLLRQGLSMEAGATHPTHGQDVARPVKV